MPIADPAYIYTIKPDVGRTEMAQFLTGMITGGAPSYFRLGEGGWIPRAFVDAGFLVTGGSQVVSGTIPVVPVVWSTLSISGGPEAVYDVPSSPYDGTGVLAGTTAAGTINYKTGAFTITFGTIVPGGTSFTASYNAWGGLEQKTMDIDVGDGSAGPYTGTLRPARVNPGSLSVEDGEGQVAEDDGLGAFQSPASGTVDYDTGAVSVTLGASVTVSNDIRATWMVEGEPGRPRYDVEGLAADDDSRLYSFRKDLVAGDVVFSGAGTAKSRVTMTVLASEANDDGTGASPYFSEGGIYSGNDVLLAYFTFYRVIKNSGVAWTQDLDLSVPA